VLADVQKKLGDLYYDKKYYKDALEAYKGQLQACESLSDRLNCAIAHRMIGEVYADVENFQEALSHQNLYLGIISFFMLPYILQYKVLLIPSRRLLMILFNNNITLNLK
jgi:tetratricopeptide (TPR) repeat protein